MIRSSYHWQRTCRLFSTCVARNLHSLFTIAPPLHIIYRIALRLHGLPLQLTNVSCTLLEYHFILDDLQSWILCEIVNV